MTVPEVRHCFVEEADYAELRHISVDGAGWPADYLTWAQRVEDFLEGVRAKGGVAVKVYVKPADLLAWCRSTGREVDASGRANYAASRNLTLQN